MHQNDDSADRKPWVTPELRTTDATTTAIGIGPYFDGTTEASSTFSVD